MSAQHLGTAQLGCIFLEFYFIGVGDVTKIYQENSSLIDIKITGTLLDNVHAYRLTLFPNITMVASVTKVNSVCVSAIVTDGTSGYDGYFDYQVTSISMFIFTIIVTKVVGCHGYVTAPRVLVVYMFYLVCVIFPYLHILTFREMVKTRTGIYLSIRWPHLHCSVFRKICIENVFDRLCGLVDRVSGYRYRGLGFDSRRYQIF